MSDRGGPLRRKVVVLAGLALSGSLLLGACGGEDDPAPAEQSTPAEAETSASDTPKSDEGSQSGALTASDAIARALEEVPGGAVVEMELGRERLTKVWDVDVLGSDGRGTSLYLAVEDGRVVEREPARLGGVTAPELAAADAVDAALGAVPGEVTALDLDREQGRVVWEALVRGDDKRRWEVYVDATSGEIVKQERA